MSRDNQEDIDRIAKAQYTALSIPSACGGCGKMRTAVTGKQYASGLFLGDCCKPKKAK